MGAHRETIEWCINQHSNTNHFYDTYLPYEFHLRMVNKAYEEFEYLLDDTVDYFTGKREIEFVTITLRTACGRAVWGHDLIEDCRVSYNNVKEHLGEEAADIIYAVSNEKGKNRKERANSKYYKGIRETSGAVFVKLCDRIANVQYSKMTKSRMFEVYKKENNHFIKELGWIGETTHPYYKMFSYLQELFK